MGYRFRKQIIIIAILVFSLALITTGVYFKWLRHEPTCFDGIQNQNEEGMDCGGPCISCEYLTIKDVEIQWVKFVLLKDNYYDLTAKISNPNPNFGLPQLNYNFKLYDAAGTEIKEQSGRSFVLPHQSKYLIEGNVSADKEVARAELVLEKPPRTEWWKLKEDYVLNLYIESKQFKFLEDQPGIAQASGVIKNGSNFDFSTVFVSVILFDENKEVIGINKTAAQTIPAGGERYFSTLWFTPIKGEVQSVDMQADTNLFSDENFMRRYGVEEKFQEYLPTKSPGKY